MRLIDSDALIERLEPYKDKYGADEFPYYMVHEAFIYEMGKEPTVDAVPVIRCKDCRYYGERMASGFWSCNRKEGCARTLPEGFCGWGVPR